MARHNLAQVKAGSVGQAPDIYRDPAANDYDPDRFTLEMERIFKRLPPRLGFSAELREPGSRSSLPRASTRRRRARVPERRSAATPLSGGPPMLRPETLADGFCFTEGPRWHEGRLWFSDMHGHQVHAVDLDGNCEAIVEVAQDPSGLGFLPDGRLLVVSMRDRRLLRLDPGGLVEVADLSSLARFHCNDMVVDGRGRAYIGNFGFDLHNAATPAAANLVLVELDGSARSVAEDLSFPNGAVITPDGRGLIVGESFGARLTAFDIAEDGSLENRREWARMQGAVPDGICLDAEGAIWVASPVSGAVLRLREGGEVTHRIEVEHQAFACMLGGPERRTLFLCTAESSDPKDADARTARIEWVEVEVPGAGLP
jgi:sugar lactone lactonase YvrE